MSKKPYIEFQFHQNQMIMPSELFDDYKSQFEEDTDIAWDENIALYFLYFEARIIELYAGNERGSLERNDEENDDEENDDEEDNLTDFQINFNTDTGITWNENLPAYILYYRSHAIESFVSPDTTRLDALEETVYENLVPEITSLRTDLTTLQNTVNSLTINLNTLIGTINGHLNNNFPENIDQRINRLVDLHDG